MSENKLSYSKAYKELETILQQIENNDLDVDNLATKVKRAAELIKICKGKLREAEAEIEEVIQDMEEED
ncbi:MAG: exodeoxyribonuclease VII small subunit [Bacteroidales bacterium]|nr:exodeoxyribonuclease VII small subunit [Bacteroidales bacterium]